MIYIGKTANNILQKNLKNRKNNKCCGCFLNKNIWIAFDNSTENCWVEEFKTEEMAICWLENFFEISEIEEFEVLRINDRLLFIPNNGYLQVNSQNDIIISKFHPLSA